MDPAITELILDNRKIAYALTDNKFTVLEVSGSINLFYIEGQNCLGRSLFDIIPELIGNENTLAQILAGRLPNFELAWVNRDAPAQETQYLVMNALPYHNQKGIIVGLIFLIQDVSQMGLLEQQIMQSRNELRLLQTQLSRQNLELAAANVELQHLSEMKSTFVSIAAHELRSPLASIIGYLEMLISEDLGTFNPEQTEALELVGASARRLLTITNNLLDLTRIEVGQMDLILQPASLTALVEQVAAEFRPQLQAKTQRLTLRASPNLPLALVDKTRAIQIISNLLSNANKYTPTGGLITIDIALADEDGFLQLAVADSGIGISAKDQTKLFERFFRADNVYEVGASGTGLGLHITRSLVELHSGLIWFHSELNQGSTFYVTFPIADDNTLPIENNFVLTQLTTSTLR